jgi:hypothetical protein
MRKIITYLVLMFVALQANAQTPDASYIQRVPRGNPNFLDSLRGGFKVLRDAWFEQKVYFNNLTQSDTTHYFLTVNPQGQCILSQVAEIPFADSADVADTALYSNIAGNSTLLAGFNPAYYLDRTNHTGTQLAATISDLTSAARTAAVADAINDGVTTIAPSQNAVYDALALKQTAATNTLQVVTDNGATTTNTTTILRGRFGGVRADTSVLLTALGDSRTSLVTSYVTLSQHWLYMICALNGWQYKDLGLSSSLLSNATPSNPFNATAGVNRLTLIPRQIDSPNKTLKFVLKYGTNDVLYNGVNYTPALFGAALRRVADTLISYGYRRENVVFSTVGWLNPYNTYSGNPAATQARHLEFNDSIRAVANAYGFRIYDWYNDERTHGGDALFRPSETYKVHEYVPGHLRTFIGLNAAFNSPLYDSTQYAVYVAGILAAERLKLSWKDTAKRLGEVKIAGFNEQGYFMDATDAVIRNQNGPTDSAQVGNINITGDIKTSSSVNAGLNVTAGEYITAGYMVSGFALRATGVFVAAGQTGNGLEISYESGGGTIWSRDRTNSVNRPMLLNGSRFGFNGDNGTDNTVFFNVGNTIAAASFEAGTKITTPFYVSTNPGIANNYDNIVLWDRTGSQRFRQGPRFDSLMNLYLLSATAAGTYVSSVTARYPIVSSGGLTPELSIDTGALPVPIMKNATVVRLQYTSPGVSTYNIYTCPEGKRAAIYTLNAFDYPNAGSSIRYHIKNASGDFIVVTNANIAAGGTGLSTATVGYIMEQGDTLQLETLTASLNVNAYITVFDTGGSNVKTVRAMNLSSGNNTVYTCPAGKSSIILASTLLPTVQTGSLNFGTDGGASRTFYFNNVPSGGSVASTNQVTKATSQNVNQRSTSAVGTALTAGDFININVDVGATNQWAFFSVLEW